MSDPLRVVHYVNQFFGGIGGDNFVSERAEDASRAIAAELDRLKPDLLVAGPAFGSGRYGLACALVCKVAQGQRVPAITAMHPENPGASSAFAVFRIAV